jgi:hypothetical protein
MSTPRFDELPYLPWPGTPIDPKEDYTLEAWTTPQGLITEFRVTRGYARYGLLPWWRRLLARWWPWLHIRFRRAHQRPDWSRSPFGNPDMKNVTLLQQFNSPTKSNDP